MVRSLTLGLVVFLACSLLTLGGCGGVNVVQPGVTMRPDDTLRDPVTKQIPPTRAHVVGVSADGKKEWESQNVTAHFMRKQDQLAALNVREFSIENGEVRLPREDPAWAAWNKPMYLIILVDLPGKGSEAGKPNDPRRHVISLNSKRWRDLDGRDLVVKITSDGVVRETKESNVEPTEF
jgi:hypothetical protein